MHYLSQFQRKGYCKTMGFQVSLLPLLVVTICIRAINMSPSGGPIITIVPSGDNVAGGNYSLECTVNVTGSNNQPMITLTWLDDDADSIISTTARVRVSGTGSVDSGYSNTLTFSPLRASDAGTFTCKAILGNNVEQELVVDITVTVHSKCRNY